MNFLAHLTLAELSATSYRGSVLGDVVKGSELSGFSPRVELGIRLHRRIDRYTDQAPQVLALKSALLEVRLRYRPIVIDILFDHLLARHWPALSLPPFDDFTRNAYQRLCDYPAGYPANYVKLVERMSKHDWLSQYQHLSGIAVTLERIAQRLRGAPQLTSASALPRMVSQAEPLFMAFWQQLVNQDLSVLLEDAQQRLHCR